VITIRIYALELNNDIKGIEARKEYIEGLLSQLSAPELVVLPELAICSYMASQEIWQYADDCGKDTSSWAVQMAQKYRTFLGVGYLDKENGDYYNRYLIAGPEGVCGVVTKSEGEAAVFKRGDFGSVIRTPFGNVAVAICYDSRRRHFYENIKDAEISLIVFPHGSPADPAKPEKEIQENDLRCMMYAEAFGVPVVYVNSKGKLEYMPGKMGSMMAKAGFRMNGRSKIYAPQGENVQTGIAEAVGMDVSLSAQKRKKEIKFYGEDILKGNWFFRTFILKPDTKAGIRSYEKNR
jgi:omega-amidase